VSECVCVCVCVCECVCVGVGVGVCKREREREKYCMHYKLFFSGLELDNNLTISLTILNIEKKEPYFFALVRRRLNERDCMH
jgi:hypothetical protein